MYCCFILVLCYKSAKSTEGPSSLLVPACHTFLWEFDNFDDVQRVSQITY
jgi:hypothetical protein